jgi:hypothetical protein
LFCCCREGRGRARAFGLPVLFLLLSFAVCLPGCGKGGAGEGGFVSFAGATGEFAGRISKVVTVAAAGDVNLGDGVTPYLTRNGIDYPWTDAAAIFKSADIAFANLECAIASCGSPVPGKEFCFRGPPESAPGLATAGIDVVSLANNHSKDYGAAALQETFVRLRECGILWCGAGENSSEAYSPASIQIRDRKVSFVAFNSIVPAGWPATAFAPGCATTYDSDVVARVIRDAAEESDYVVASFHWGIELQTAPNSSQESLARLAVDSGADLVLGHHPHVVQGFELYKNRLIAYSLGNFVFSPPREISARTLALTATIGPGGLIQARVVPMFIRSCRPEVLHGNQATSWLEKVSFYCGQLGTDMEVEGDVGLISGEPLTADPSDQD